jgi:hypothetical protein
MLERRRFTLRDLMIVIAAVAISLWLSPDHLSGAFVRALDQLVRDHSFRKPAYTIRLMLNGDPNLIYHFSIQPMALVWTLTLLLLEYLHYRPPLHRLARQPGFAACLAVVVVIVLVGSMNFAFLEYRMDDVPLWPKVRAYLALTLTFNQGQCAAAVAIAWLTLALTGRWRPRPDWLDRAGRALGIFWLAVVPLVWIEASLFS